VTSEPSPAPIKFGKRPLKQSSLRRSINVNDDQDGTSSGGLVASLAAADDGPVVVRPSLGRSGSTKLKKRSSTSRLSFGPSSSAVDDDDDNSTPKEGSLGQRALENSAFRKSITKRLPTRPAGDEDEDETRPRYSKEYLAELQNSTPNTPQNLTSLRINDDEMELDPSELEGAVVVEASQLVVTSGAPSAVPAVLTEAEIQERKERRARLKHEEDFISLDDSDPEQNGGYVSLVSKKGDKGPRLVAEDEDLGEGYDEFVEDGRLSLGKRAEKEARKRRKQEMAELINAAEGDEDEESDDSEAERRAAYEAAQTRAGMDGLHRTKGDFDEDDAGGPMMIPKMKPLPDLGGCLAKMQGLVRDLEMEVSQRRNKLVQLEKEKEEISNREKEVQEILDKAGQKYQSAMGPRDARAVGQSPLRPIPPGMAGEFSMERGLESLGTTPTRRPEALETE